MVLNTQIQQLPHEPQSIFPLCRFSSKSREIPSKSHGGHVTGIRANQYDLLAQCPVVPEVIRWHDMMILGGSIRRCRRVTSHER